jgi:hypothetical protein
VCAWLVPLVLSLCLGGAAWLLLCAPHQMCPPCSRIAGCRGCFGSVSLRQEQIRGRALHCMLVTRAAILLTVPACFLPSACVAGHTTYTLGPDGLITLQDQTWSISSTTALIESFTPTRGVSTDIKQSMSA